MLSILVSTYARQNQYFFSNSETQTNTLLDYDRAAEMLQPTPYPEHYPPLKKLTVLEKQAEALGQKQNFYRVPQTTFFHTSLNSAGVQMKASTGSGQDCTGVNDGSKNSVLMNYIPDAWNWGAEIFCACEVRYICKEPKREGYVVYFAWHDSGREKFKDAFETNFMWVRAVSIGHTIISAVTPPNHPCRKSFAFSGRAL